MSLKIAFIGAGNLATQLSGVLNENQIKIVQVYSRTLDSAKMLGDKLQVNYTNEISKIDTTADIFFVALKDDVINEVLAQIDFQNKLLVHCSGSLPLSVLETHSKNIGVFYPLQTFSKNRNVDFKTVPVFIESNKKHNEKVLVEIATKISDSVTILESEKRKLLHVSAVFASNFVNHLYAISAELLGSKGIPFDALKPLILETAKKVQELEPKSAQTGPAVRLDEKIIASHVKELEGLNNYQELYKSISRSIFEYHKIDK